MTKINLKDIQHKIIVSNDATIDNDNYISIEPRIGCKKVNLKDIHNLLRAKKEVVYTSFDVELTTYKTEEEIEFMKSLLRIKAFRNHRKNKTFDLAEQHLFNRLTKHDQIKLVVNLLEADILVVIDGHIEVPNDNNIAALKELIVKYENVYKQKQLIVNHNISNSHISLK
jgi:hypothetical protein